ncbi:helix-turn-helix transcriptional regulator [Lutimaribacter saemankumensis]|uniref:Helix-turn-helix n=1 Tax=Lutimaribacter saemankumensis TaxID=490829 RepID=A0A1G8HYZ4_9RHOB|nr:helix-turn-helix transcriptional regulator [Lutimaribacter saemankumensis]SDI11824.1 Helix-turn-helix [Lutimaribacter saemankumensis]
MQTGNDLKQARIALGWSQRELAQRAGIDRKAVSYWEMRAVLDSKGYATGKMAAVLGGEFSD